MENNLSFGTALKAVEAGKSISREGWNGKGMYLLYVPEGGYFITKLNNPSHKDVGNISNGAFIGMKTADNKIVPWLASQTDILAKDWCILD
jgi:hypothetical protein